MKRMTEPDGVKTERQRADGTGPRELTAEFV